MSIEKMFVGASGLLATALAAVAGIAAVHRLEFYAHYWAAAIQAASAL